MAKLLIVDDDEAVLRMTKDYFSGKMEEIFTVKTSGEGLRVAFEEKPDIVILDYCLPDGPGDEALRQIKTYLPGIKVVIVTGEDDEELKEKVLGFGCDAYFNKADLSLAQLGVTIQNLLAESDSF